MDQYKAGLSDVIDHDDPLAYNKVTKIALNGVENRDITRQEESKDSYCKDDVYFLQGENGNLPLDTARVDSYLKGIRQLKLKDYVTYNVTEKELADYGLDAPELTVTVDYTYQEPADKGNGGKKEPEEKSGTYVLKLGRSPADRKKTPVETILKETDGGKQEEKEKAENDITAYVRIGDSQIVYEVKGKEYLNIIKASYDEFRHKKAFTGDLQDVSEIDVVMEDKEYLFTSKLEDGERVWSYQGGEVSFAGFETALNGLTADSFTGEEPEKKREVSLTFHLDNDTFPQVQVELYRYDGAHCLAVVDGESVSLIARGAAVELMEAVNAIVLD